MTDDARLRAGQWAKEALNAARLSVKHNHAWLPDLLEEYAADAVAQAVKERDQRLANALEYIQRWSELRAIVAALRAPGGGEG